MAKQNTGAAGQPDPQGQPDHKKAAFISRFALGEDPRTIAEGLSIPFDTAAGWLRDAPTLAEVAEIRQWLVNSYHAHGAHLVTSAMLTLEAALGADPELAAKVVLASGILKATAENPSDVLADRVRVAELSSRLRFLDKLRDMGLSEEEWNRMMEAPRPTRRSKRSAA